jgi:mannose-1-phosphate guanylyltransferase/mannose-6-phosphate isomerase
MEVDSFVEKPDVATAREYLRDGRYLWNSGIFLMGASVWLEALQRCRPDIAQACLDAYNASEKDGSFLRPHRDGFLSCPPESIDYAVMEKTAEDAEVRVATVPLSGGWSDLGSWAQIWEEREGDEDGNVVEGPVYLESVQNSLVLSTERTVAAVGLKDAVVVETPDAVLVASRDQVQNVRRVAERLNNKAHNRQPDGRLKVDEGTGFILYRITIEPGEGLNHLASLKGETWTQASGKTKLLTDLDERTLEAGDSVRLAPNHAYRMENCGPDSSEALLMVLEPTQSTSLEEGLAS